jgi:rSAM/selenodomain-associated transferase 2
MKPSLSIIIPALNEQTCLGDTLTILQAARHRGHELIVVDGGSDDHTLQVCSDLVDQCLQSKRGRAIQMNTGVSAASADTLLFLHADTRPPENIDRLIVAALAGQPGWGRFDIRLSGRQPLLRLVERLMNLRSRLSGIATGDQGLFVSRAWFERVGGFPDIALMEDIVLSKRLKRLARPHCLKARLVTSSRRWEQRGVIRTVLKMWWLRAAFFCGVPAHYLAKQYG